MICPQCKQEVEFVFVVSEFTQKQIVKGDVFLEEYEDVNDAIGDVLYKQCPNCLSVLEGKSHSFLEAQVDRLLKAQGGHGMVSEMNDMQEVAVLVSGLHDRITEYEKPQSQCGHKARYVVAQSEDGTGFCLMCVFGEVSHMMAHRDKILNEINRLAMLPADNSEIKDGESDNPLDILMRVSLLSAIHNRRFIIGVLPVDEINSVKELPDCELMLLLLTHEEAAALIKRKGMYLYKVNEKNCYVFVELPAYMLMRQKKEN